MSEFGIFTNPEDIFPGDCGGRGVTGFSIVVGGLRNSPEYDVIDGGGRPTEDIDQRPEFF